ncbi:hypothetical protein [Methanobrevibacter ruminantium]|uniref:hypothetical protein n=1 Tax=Methanobrevibacter ruminantium TaxID=83816 RepID=UPI002D80A0D1|nr:hypothetical protein [Methanobrevibacter ruminantium]
MRFKYLFLGLMLLILAGSMTAIAAADDYEPLGDYTFDIPDGYQVTDKTDEMVIMQVDEDHPIIVYKLDSVADVDSFISLLETTGCKFSSEDAFQAGSFDVTSYGYTYLDAQGFFYICDDGKGTPILVASSGPSTEGPLTVDDNPARIVVDSLE